MNSAKDSPIEIVKEKPAVDDISPNSKARGIKKNFEHLKMELNKKLLTSINLKNVREMIKAARQHNEKKIEQLSNFATKTIDNF